MFEPNPRSGGRSFFLGILIAGIVFLFVLLQLVSTVDKPSDTNQEPPPGGDDTACIVTGCSGQVCAEENIVTTCEFREEYACYKGAECERQADGECGWTETPELQNCLSEANR